MPKFGLGMLSSARAKTANTKEHREYVGFFQRGVRRVVPGFPLVSLRVPWIFLWFPLVFAWFSFSVFPMVFAVVLCPNPPPKYPTHAQTNSPNAPKMLPKWSKIRRPRSECQNPSGGKAYLSPTLLRLEATSSMSPEP